MFKEYPDVLTVKQLAKMLGICPNKAYEMVNKKVIGSRRVGSRILVPKKCVIDYLESASYNVSV